MNATIFYIKNTAVRSNSLAVSVQYEDNLFIKKINSALDTQIKFLVNKRAVQQFIFYNLHL